MNASPVSLQKRRFFLPPPLTALASIALGALLERRWPTPVLAPALALAAAGAGLVVALGAVVLLAASVREFRKAGTALRPWRPTTVLVTSGPFSRSRNPIYLAVVLIQLGAGLLSKSVWIAALALATLWLIQATAILREEQALKREFCETYEAYKERVPRWF